MTSRAVPLVCLILAFGIALGYVSPMYTEDITELQAAIENNDKALAAAKAYKEKENQLVAEKDNIPPADLARLQTLLPDSVNNVRLILDLNALAARTGVVLTSIDVATLSQSTEGSDNPIGAIDLTLAATGSYRSFHNFLLGVERSARLLDVVKIGVTGSDTGVYQYAVTLRIYWLH